MKSFRRILIRELVVLHALMVAVGSLLAWVGLTRWANQQAEVRVTTDLRQLDRALSDRFHHLEQLADVIARFWQEGTLDPTQDTATWRLLSPLVTPYPALTGVNLVRTDGAGFGLGHLLEGWAGRGIRRQKGTWASGPLFGKAQGPAGQAAPQVSLPMDFRIRPWYQLGARLTEGRWSTPYLYIGRLAGQPGLSYVRPVFSAQGDLLGVLSLDLLLDSMTQVVQELRPTPECMVLLVDSEGRILVPPDGGPAEDPGVRQKLFLQPLQADRFPLALRLFKEGAATGKATALREGWSHSYGLASPFRGARGLEWHLLLMVPTKDFLSDPLLRALAVVSLSGLLTLGLAWRVVRLGSRFADPLSSLEAATTRLGQDEDLSLPASDIREIRGLSQALQNAHTTLQERDRLQDHLQQHQKLETVGTLAGGIAHDVNNQLTAILGQISLGRERIAIGKDPDANLQRAEEATRRCAETTRALLSFSRPAHFERISLDLNAVVREAALLLKRGLGPHIRLELALSPDLPPVMGDPVQLEQVLMNLGMNARDALPAGGLLRLGTSPLGGTEVLLWVEDNGVGMRPEVLSRIFDPFFTTKPVGQGSGLGLSMVHGIAKAHGATLEVDSEWGRGTTFRLRLPAASTPSLRAGGSPTPPRGPWLKGRRILVVEDEPSIRQVLIAAFDQAGALCATSEDGEAGWTTWQGGSWDLVLSDHHMPRLTGLELLERIRRSDPQTPVILASGRGLEGIEALLAADPRLRFLPKPFHLNGLLLTIQELLET